MADEKTKEAPKEAPKAGDVVGEDKKKGVIYVVHPVSAAQKKELVKKGKIIDAKFK